MASLRDIFNNRVKKPISNILSNSARGYQILGNRFQQQAAANPANAQRAQLFTKLSNPRLLAPIFDPINRIAPYVAKDLVYSAQHPKEIPSILNKRYIQPPVQFARKLGDAAAQPYVTKINQQISDRSNNQSDLYLSRALELSKQGDRQKAQTYFNAAKETQGRSRNLNTQRIADITQSKTDLIRSAVGTANVAAALYNPMGTLKTNVIGGLLGSAIAGVSGEKEPGALYRSMDETAKWSGFTNLTNPAILAGSHKLSLLTKNPATKTVVTRLANGIGNVLEDKAISTAYGDPYTANQAILSLGIGMILGGGGSKQDYDNFKKELTTIGLSPQDTQAVIREFNKAKSRLPENPTHLKWEENGQKQSLILGKQDARDWTAQLQSRGVEYKLTNLGSQGGFIAGAGATGWDDAPGKFSSLLDKKAKFEIDDSQSKVATEGINELLSNRSTQLSRILKHDELYKNYPELRNVKVLLTRNAELAGSYDPKTNVIRLSEGIQNGKSTLLHEIQHAIQQKEGFAMGGMPENMKSPISDRSHEMWAWVEDILQIKPGLDPEDYMRKSGVDEKMITDVLDTIKETPRNELDQTIKYVTQNTPMNSYKRLSGELEARAVQRRMNLTPEQRASSDPYSAEALATTGTTRPEDFITRFDSGSSANIPKELKPYIGSDGKVTLYHGSNTAFNKEKADYGTFLTANKQEALDYAQMRAKGRGGSAKVSEIKLDPSEVRLNQATGEFQYIGKSKSLDGKYSQEIYKAYNDVNASNLTAKEIDKLPLDDVRGNASMGLEGGREQFDTLYNQATQSNIMASVEPSGAKPLSSILRGGTAPGQSGVAPGISQPLSRIPLSEPTVSLKMPATSDQLSSIVSPQKVQGSSSVQTTPQTKGETSPETSYIPKVTRKTTEVTPLNTKRLDLNADQKQRVDDAQVKEVREILSNKEIIRIAKSAGIDTKTHTVDQTAKKIAEQLNVRRQVVELENQRTNLLKTGTPEELESLTRQIADKSRVSREQGTEVAQQLAARRIIANEINTPMQRVFQLLDKAGVNPDVYTKDAAKIDFTDGKAVVDFYRKYVPAGGGEWLDLLRYNSMLSSPNTQINNAMSNLQGSLIVAPIEKTITGGLDAIKSALTGKPRSYYAGEGGAYTKGYLKSVGEAVQNFSKVMRGEKLSANPDYKYLPLTQSGTTGRRLEGLFNKPMRFLEAADQFFTTLTKGGETASLKYRASKGVSVRSPELQAEAAAAKRLFRSPLGDNNGSKALDAIDVFANTIQGYKDHSNFYVRNIAKFTLPFVRTPTNILKQGVEYSPLGIGTLWGSSTKTEQISKTLMGTSIAVGAATLLSSDRITWAEPTGEKQKAAFRAAGMQPYAVKVGDNWISYSKMHPAIAFNLALVAAVKHSEDNKDIDESQAETALKIGAKWVNFFADQSYVKSIGDLVGGFKGDIEAPARIGGNYLQQIVPFRALMGWVARLVDPYQRKVDPDGGLIEQQLQQLATQIPFVSMTVPARLDQFGNPIENQNRLFNAISPVRVTTENPEAKKEFEFLQEKSLFEKEKRQLREIFEREAQSDSPSVGQVSAADEYVEGKGVPETGERGGLLGIFDKLTGGKKEEPAPPSQVPSGTIRSMSKLEKDKLKTYIEFGRAVSADDLISYYLGDLEGSSSDTGYKKTTRQKELFNKIATVKKDELLSPQQKEVIITAISEETGTTPEDLEYYSIAQNDDDVKLSYLVDDQAITTKSHDEMLKLLAEQRKTINGKQISSDGVIDQLYELEHLSKDEAKYLKAIKWDATKNQLYLDRDFKAGGGGGKQKLAAYLRDLQAVSKAQGEVRAATLSPLPIPGRSNLEAFLSRSGGSGAISKGTSLDSIFNQLEKSKKSLRNLKYR